MLLVARHLWGIAHSCWQHDVQTTSIRQRRVTYLWPLLACALQLLQHIISSLAAALEKLVCQWGRQNYGAAGGRLMIEQQATAPSKQQCQPSCQPPLSWLT